MTLTREALARMVSPLSACQQRVWRLAPRHDGLFERISLRILGPLPTRRVEIAWRAALQRHAVLRSIFPVLNDRPVQCVRSSGPMPLLVDLRALPSWRQEQAAWRLARDRRQPPFDLRRGPLVRLALLHMHPHEHVLVMHAHHLVFDGDSRAILMRELGALLTGAERLPPMTIQYADVARREQMPRPVAERARRLSTRVARLDRLAPPITLPLDRPRSEWRTHRGGFLPLTIAPQTVIALRQLARSEGLSMLMLVLAALAIVLRHEARQDEVTFGIPASTRTSADTERLIGPFVNLLIVRLSAPAGMRVRDLVTQARAELLDALAHRDLPFDDLLRAMFPRQALDSYGPLGGPPLFRVCVDYNEAPAAGPPSREATSGLTLRPFEAPAASAGCDLFLSLTAAGHRLDGSVLYAAELFERSTIERVVWHLQAALAVLPSAWQAPLSDVTFLGIPS